MESRKTLRAQHDATLPSAHADRTRRLHAVLFAERRNHTTWAHQVASAAVSLRRC